LICFLKWYCFEINATASVYYYSSPVYCLYNKQACTIDSSDHKHAHQSMLSSHSPSKQPSKRSRFVSAETNEARTTESSHTAQLRLTLV
jgi:hypothetical protein